ncbi:MAG: GAF domain-containing protein [Chloroflexi bacterium]|nr:MAG: GAF domain-containing protein [Chloroflexota bacterium]
MAASLSWKDVPGAILIYDRAGQVIDANDAAVGLLGLSRDRLLGTYAEDAEWLVLEAPEGPMSVHPVTATLKSLQAVRGVLARASRPEGTDIWIQVDAVPQLNVAGEVTLVTASLCDVTHLFARSRLTSRGAGEHIVNEVVGELADARLETHSILHVVTNALSRMRPGTWVASLLNKDPSTSLVVAADVANSELVEYINRHVASLDHPGQAPTTGISQRVIESGKPLLLPQVPMSELWEMIAPGVAAYVAEHPLPIPIETSGVVVVPMRARGAVVGTLALYERRSSNPLTEKDIIWMQAIADRTALAIENAQLYEDAVIRLERLGSLQSLSLALSASPDLRLTLKVILDQVTAQLKVDAADVLLLEESDNMLALAASTGFLATAVPDYRLPVDEGLPGRALTGRRIETLTALSAFSQFRRRSLFAREGFKAYGAVPLITRGKLLGALEVYHRTPLSPDQEWVSWQGTAAPQRAPSPPQGLSLLEIQIIRLMVEGLTNREIAAQVHLSQNTIKFHVRQILQKTGASNRTELAHQAAKDGWL